MKIADEFEPYRDKFGLIHPGLTGPTKLDGISHNGLRFLSEYVICLINHDQMTKSEETKIMNSVLLCESTHGLFRRHPYTHYDSQIGIDDYIGLLTLSYYVFPIVAMRVIDYGDKNFWVFNSVNPGQWDPSAWLGRFPALRAHAYFCAKRRPPLLWRLAWCGAVLWAMKAKRDDQDAWMLSYHLVQVVGDNSWMCTRIAVLWKWRFRNVHPHGAGGVLKSYFNKEATGEAPHPSERFLLGDYG